MQPALPVAKKNIVGQIISNTEELKLLYLDHFAFRMRSRPIMSHLQKYKSYIENEFNEILEITKKI